MSEFCVVREPYKVQYHIVFVHLFYHYVTISSRGALVNHHHQLYCRVMLAAVDFFPVALLVGREAVYRVSVGCNVRTFLREVTMVRPVDQQVEHRKKTGKAVTVHHCFTESEGRYLFMNLFPNPASTFLGAPSTSPGGSVDRVEPPPYGDGRNGPQEPSSAQARLVLSGEAL